MDVVSTYKFARISARKARDVGREIQGLPVSEALDILAFTPRKGAELFEKTMKTALADAENNFQLELDTLIVKEATVGEGPTFKRFKPRARGSASGIRKRTSHIRVVLTDEYETKEKTRRINVSESKRKATGKKEKSSVKPNKEKGKEPKPKTEAKAEGDSGSRVDEDRGLVYDSRPSKVDDLTEINGVGPKLEEKLNDFGIYTFEQIANWNEDNIAEFDELLSFKGRIERDDWVGLAKELVE